MYENDNLNPNAIDLSQQSAAAPMPQLTLNYSEPQAAAPQPPPRSPEVILSPARAGGGGVLPTLESGTERGRRAGGMVRRALA